MAKDADEVASVVVGDQGDEGISGGASEEHYGQKLSLAVVRRSGGGEKHAGWSREGNGGRGQESTRSPLLEELQEFRYPAFLEFAFKVGGPGAPRKVEREVSADDGSGSGHGGVFVPRVAVRGGEDCGKDVWAGKSWKRGTVENCEREKAHGPEVLEHGGEGSRATPACRFLNEEIQHSRNISSWWSAAFVMRTFL